MEVHRCRFVEYQPASINSLSFTPSTVKESRLAVGRANGDIEIWDPTARYNLEKTLPGGQDLSVESVVWAHQSVLTNVSDDEDPESIERARKRLLEQPPRLFSSGFNPYVLEWDTTSLTVKRSVDCNGGAIWCLAVNSNGTRLAAGCEDGRIRLFDISDGQLEYMKAFEPQRGRILSIAWSPDNLYIVTGAADSSLRKWDVATGRTVSRMMVDTPKNDRTLVWAVAALQDDVLVSGDSMGNIMFWDGKRGTTKQSFKSHDADILALAYSPKENVLYSAGVDCKVVTYRKVQGKMHGKKNEWVVVARSKRHSHDIRALAIEERSSTLVSGGVDTQLSISPLEGRWYAASPFARKNIVSISKSRQLVMATFFNSISIWRLGQAAPIDMALEKPSIPELMEGHRSVLELQLKSDCNITSSALSEDGNWIVVADVENVRLFQVQQVDGTDQLRVKKVRAFEKCLAQYLATHNAALGAHHVLLTPGSDKLIIVTVESRILIVDMLHWEEDGVFEVVKEFGHHRGLDSDGGTTGKRVATIINVAVSADGQWLATGDDENRINVFNLDSLKIHFELPHSFTPHTALSFNEFRPNELFVGQATNEFYIYNVESRRLSTWYQKYHSIIPKCKLTHLDDPIRGVAYNPSKPDLMIVYGSSYLCLVDLSTNRPAPQQQLKRKKLGSDPEELTEDPKITRILQEYNQILHCEFLKENSMVIVERPKFSILEKLPPSFYKPRFSQ